ncbi:MAG: macro domain-containing protein [Oscillospiraceae bacterium]|nr:macro domain-containing protein [Oscillospiraceae bacterium]
MSLPSKAEENGLESLAFCCISTGVLRFPKWEAAKIAVQTVPDCLAEGRKLNKLVFVIHDDKNFSIYRNLLN